MWDNGKNTPLRALNNEINPIPFAGLFSDQNTRVIVRDIFSWTIWLVVGIQLFPLIGRLSLSEPKGTGHVIIMVTSNF